MPSPNKNEKQSDFISRCMSSEESKKSFPSQDQRVAFCHSQWDNEGKAAEETFVYKHPQTGELYYYNRRGTYRKNNRTLVFVKKIKGTSGHIFNKAESEYLNSKQGDNNVQSD